jgi:hypothetical protein
MTSPAPNPSNSARPVISREQLARAQALTAGQLAEIMGLPDSPFLQACPRGFLRGIDHFTPTALIKVTALGAQLYNEVHGIYPNLANPQRLTEKMAWAKIFRPMKVPQAGDKLRVSELVGEQGRAMAPVPEVVWRSHAAELPPSDSLEPGSYYLKTNHGSDMFRRIDWPLDEADRRRLEAEFAGYLKKDYGFWSGEWWYLRFRREVFLERNVSSDPFPIAWCCYTFSGRIGLVIAYRKIGGESHTSWLRPDFTPLDWQNPGKPRTEFALPSPPARRKMLEAASAIGRPYSFVRVDFLLGDDEEIYLSELTFTPGNALTAWPAHLDLEFGAMWLLDPMKPRP